LILVDTSVWVDHLRKGDAALAALLERGAVAMHPFIIGELACGSLADRARPESARCHRVAGIDRARCV
jgi:predicted nucleic acid-binding protein